MTNKFFKYYAIALTVLVVAYFTQLAVCPPDYTLHPNDWENIYQSAYQKVMADYEYHVNIDLDGYDVYNETGTQIGYVPYQDCNTLDSIFIADNQ